MSENGGESFILGDTVRLLYSTAKKKGEPCSFHIAMLSTLEHVNQCLILVAASIVAPKTRPPLAFWAGQGTANVAENQSGG